MRNENLWPDHIDEEENMEEIEDEEEFELEEENSEMDEENAETTEEEDEPDFMDNSGQLWEFVCQIGDGQDLGKFMGQMEGMMVEKEDNNKWQKFGCAENGECSFQTILLKSCMNLYSRGVHNHDQGNKNEKKEESENRTHNQMEDVKPKAYFSTTMPSLNVGDDYVDILGKSWNFHSKIGDENPSWQKLRAAFGFSRIYPQKTTLNMYCRKEGPGGRKCKFAGVYLRTNGCVYTRGEHECSEKQSCSNLYSSGKHNHLAEEESNKNGSQNADFKQTAQNGRLAPPNFCLYCHIQNDEHLQKVLKKNVLIQDKMYNEGARCNYGCKWYNNTRQMHPKPSICKFRGIYDRKSGNFYLKNAEHVHNKPMKLKERKPNSPRHISSANVAPSKKWETSKNINDIVDDNKEKNQTDAFVNELKPLQSINIENHDFFDKFGNSWPFLAQIGKNIPKEQFYPRFGISRVQRKKYGFYLCCAKKARGTGKRCSFRAIYVESTGCLYAKSTKHDHTGAFDFKMLKNKKRRKGNG